MSKVASSLQKPSDVVLYELGGSYGHERKKATVLIAAGMQPGAVVKSDGDGTYSWIADADVATLPADVAIVIDADADYETAGDADVAVISGGPGSSGGVGVNRVALKYADAVTAANQALVEAALAAKGIKVQ